MRMFAGLMDYVCRPLQLVIDEFDQIPNPSGFASFLKALATNSPNVKFCIVGVAKDIQALMREHESTDRLFAGSIIGMEPMHDNELEAIIENAEQFIDKYITFDSGARRKIIGLSNGHPYMANGKDSCVVRREVV